MFKHYIAYLKDNPKGYWFKAKWFGWGWTPATWQGWAVTLTYIALILIVGFRVGANTNSVSDTLYGILIPDGILTVILIVICLLKGERPYWNWGGQEKSK